MIIQFTNSQQTGGYLAVVDSTEDALEVSRIFERARAALDLPEIQPRDLAVDGPADPV